MAKYCHDCGNEVVPNKKYCGKCGAALLKNSTNLNNSQNKESNWLKETIIWASIYGLIFAVVVQIATWDKLGFDFPLFVFTFIAGFLMTLMARHLNSVFMKLLKGDKEK